MLAVWKGEAVLCSVMQSSKLPLWMMELRLIPIKFYHFFKAVLTHSHAQPSLTLSSYRCLVGTLWHHVQCTRSMFRAGVLYFKPNHWSSLTLTKLFQMLWNQMHIFQGLKSLFHHFFTNLCVEGICGSFIWLNKTGRKRQVSGHRWRAKEFNEKRESCYPGHE